MGSQHTLLGRITPACELVSLCLYRPSPAFVSHFVSRFHPSQPILRCNPEKHFALRPEGGPVIGKHQQTSVEFLSRLDSHYLSRYVTSTGDDPCIPLTEGGGQIACLGLVLGMDGTA